jgi:hypothetical protein
MSSMSHSVTQDAYANPAILSASAAIGQAMGASMGAGFMQTMHVPAPAIRGRGRPAGSRNQNNLYAPWNPYR